MKRLLIIATAMLMSWFVYIDGSQVFAGPFTTYAGCAMTARFLNANFSDYFTCE